MLRFCDDIRKYYRYIFYSAKSTLKQEVADSFLNWIWLILNPIMFMLVYAFVQICIFGNETKYLATFLFIGLTCWNFFQPSINSSVRLIKRYENILSRIYVPKFVLLLSNMMVISVKTLISFGLVILSILAYRIPFSPYMLWSIPYLLLLFLVTFGLSCICMHIGVFVDDVANIIQIGMRMLFFLSGIFYDLEGRLDGVLVVVMARLNPVAHVIVQMRHIILDGQAPSYIWFIRWTVAGVILSVVGVWLIYHYERRYVKTI